MTTSDTSTTTTEAPATTTPNTTDQTTTTEGPDGPFSTTPDFLSTEVPGPVDSFTPATAMPIFDGDATTMAAAPADGPLPPTGSYELIGGLAAAVLIIGLVVARLARRPRSVG